MAYRFSRIVLFMILVAIAAVLSGCGGDDEGSSDDSAPDTPGAVEDFPQGIEFASEGQVNITGVSGTTFNSLTSTIRFEISGTTLDTSLGDVAVFHNGEIVPDDMIEVLGNITSLSFILEEGRNDLKFHATDAQGHGLYTDIVVWAGSQTLTVTVLDEAGQEVSGATVTAVLGDDKNVISEATSIDGEVSFQNLPDRTILLSAVASENRFASLATIGAAGTAQIQLSGFDEPSSITNNDFSLGTEGWNIGDAPVELIPHVESSEDTVQTNSFELAQPTLQPKVAQDEDIDLALTTSGEGPQHISRAFVISPGAKTVTIRYRFVTSEFPTYYGSQYNDSFAVQIRSLKGGKVASESNSMNALGRAAFSEGGATAWRETSLQVDELGDTIQVDIIVTNVGDGVVDSTVIVDLIREASLAITKLDLRDLPTRNQFRPKACVTIEPGHLQYVSAAGQHNYFSGNAHIHGAVTVEGDMTDGLESLELEILQGGEVVATAQLADTASELKQPFGSDEKVEITDIKQLLFVLSAGQAGRIDASADGTVGLRVKAESKSGQEATKEYERSVGILVNLNANAHFRYPMNLNPGSRDGCVGGDDWVRPSVREVVNHFLGNFTPQITVGDISNMHGGSFSPDHAGHRDGTSVDAFFNGYDKGDADTAKNIIRLLNDPVYGTRIQRVLVDLTFRTNFQDALNDEQGNPIRLIDGRRATDVIGYASGHDTHFHLDIFYEICNTSGIGAPLCPDNGTLPSSSIITTTTP